MISQKEIRLALLIRRTEETLLKLFSEGKLGGTIHTCCGQEFSGIAFSAGLRPGDFIFSNHRCHGHYIARTGDAQGLIAELMGKKSGTCSGIGSSQHLFKGNFFSNGVQGGIVPIAAGMALAAKKKSKKDIGLVFIGDGTLGQGVVYETMNIAALLEIPLLIICENNYYAQSTKVSANLAGDIISRAQAFGLTTFHSNTWDLENLFHQSQTSINFVRENNTPVFHLVDTYRLNHHSKSDDSRDLDEVLEYTERDPLNKIKVENGDTFEAILSDVDGEIARIIEEVNCDTELKGSEYFSSQVNSEIVENNLQFAALDKYNDRMVDRINLFFDELMGRDKRVLFVGEDVLSPYGGAFKVSKGLSKKYPGQVISTPISEQAITGLSSGLALGGFKPYLEIMFGDFMTLTLDQIINHASKFFHMYNKKVNCPVVIRTPMGGGRGYGPTHSQTLDKLLVGIDNVSVVALNSLLDPKILYESVHDELHPVIVIENKIEYGRFVGQLTLDGYEIKRSIGAYPVIICRPLVDAPTLTFVTYGGIACDLINSLHAIFRETELIPEVIVMSKICPLDISPILDSVRVTNKIVAVEEGGEAFGVGAEIIAKVVEQLGKEIGLAKRVGALPVPIPSVRSLEDYVLPNNTLVEDIARKVL